MPSQAPIRRGETTGAGASLALTKGRCRHEPPDQLALARAQERTTWYGLASLLASVGVAIAPEVKSAVAEVGLALSGLALVWTKEAARPDQPAQE